MTLNRNDRTHASNGIPRPCWGCRHYFGQMHGGNTLHCGMNAYGPESDPCPDHEQLTADKPRTSTTMPYQGPTTRDGWEALPNDAVVWRAMERRMVDSLWRVVQDLNL